MSLLRLCNTPICVDSQGPGLLGIEVEEHLESFKNMELKLPMYGARSPQLRWRRYFLDLLISVSNHYKLCSATRHLSVYLLDIFMDKFQTDDKLLYIVTIICLILSAKFEERDKVPRLEELNRLAELWHIDIVLTKRNLMKMELWLLRIFDWNLCLPTAEHFIDYYLFASITESDLNGGWLVSHEDLARAIVEINSRYFLELSLQDHVFRSFRPSLVAAACAFTARAYLMLSPSWTAELQQQTGYSWVQLVPCMSILVSTHEREIEALNRGRIRTLYFHPQQVLESLAVQTLPTQVLFEQPPYHPLAERSYVSVQFCSPLVNLFFAYRASLLASQPPSGLAPGHSSRYLLLTNSLPSYPTLQATVQPDLPSVSTQPLIFLQVALPAELEHWLPLILGSGFFIEHHPHANESFDE